GLCSLGSCQLLVRPLPLRPVSPHDGLEAADLLRLAEIDEARCPHHLDPGAARQVELHGAGDEELAIRPQTGGKLGLQGPKEIARITEVIDPGYRVARDGLLLADLGNPAGRFGDKALR